MRLRTDVDFAELVILRSGLRIIQELSDNAGAAFWRKAADINDPHRVRACGKGKSSAFLVRNGFGPHLVAHRFDNLTHIGFCGRPLNHVRQLEAAGQHFGYVMGHAIEDGLDHRIGDLAADCRSRQQQARATIGANTVLHAIANGLTFRYPGKILVKPLVANPADEIQILETYPLQSG
ncbi:hypothetical protein IP70_21155 [alpha proteobacterium AAP38]|nr:hypothetical protein IP70_21155 [alpha proteobacterium AAP38]